MVYIRKQHEPRELTVYKKEKGASFSDLSGNNKVAVYNSLIKEQYGLCAYCMCRIFYNTETNRNIRIEHFIPQSDSNLGDAKSLDYKNMLGVCDGGVSSNRVSSISGAENISCDAFKGNKTLSLNPSVKEDYERMRIRYSSSGKIHSENKQFDDELNAVLNLNNYRLIEERKRVKQAVVSFLNTHKKLTTTQREYKISQLQTPKDGLLMPFYDVAIFFIKRIQLS